MKAEEIPLFSFTNAFVKFVTCRQTFVHRFLVRGTIEQRMHYLLETVQAPVNSHDSEETNMTIGDLTALFQEIQVSNTL